VFISLKVYVLIQPIEKAILAKSQEPRAKSQEPISLKAQRSKSEAI
jgi:hypothetical protein